MPFIAYEIALDALRLLKPVVGRIRVHDAALAQQMLDAGASAPMNLAEGRKRFGRDRRHLFRVAGGSAGEVKAALEIARVLDYVSVAESDAAWRAYDRLCAITWRLIS